MLPPLNRLLNSFGYACQGLGHVVRTQPNFRIHLGLTVVVIGASIWLGLARWEWVAILLTVGIMLITETLNTALEASVDAWTEGQRHPGARIAKDVAAAACMISATLAVVMAGVIFGPKLWVLWMMFRA